MTGLAEIQAGWDEAARTNAMWNILTIPGHEEWNHDDFFEHGRREIAHVFDRLDQAGLIVCRGRALDFGCGIGRLTQALAERFEQAVGIDISPEMIRRAVELDRHGCVFRINATNDLAMFDADVFDFGYSNIVLQHMPPEMAKGYIRELVRVVDGVVVFEIPEGHSVGGGHLRMYGTTRGEIEECVVSAGGEIVAVDSTGSAGPAFISHRYMVRS